MNNREKIKQLIQTVKNLMATENEMTDDQEMERNANHYELNIIAQLLHDAEIIGRREFLELVRLYPIRDPFSRLQQINNIAVGFLESGPYCENEPPIIIETMRKIETISEGA